MRDDQQRPAVNIQKALTPRQIIGRGQQLATGLNLMGQGLGQGLGLFGHEIVINGKNDLAFIIQQGK